MNQRREGKRLCLVLSLVLCFVVCLVIVLSAFFLYPRIPVIDNTTLDTSKSVLGPPAEGKITLTLPIVVQVNNPNFIKIDLNKVALNATHPLYPNVIGTSMATQLELNARSPNQLPMNFTLVYSLLDDVEHQYIKSLLTNCTDHVQSYIVVKASAEYSALLTSGTQSIEPFEFYFDCPLTEDQTANFQKLISWLQ